MITRNHKNTVMKLLSALGILVFIISCSPSQDRIEQQQPIGSRLQLFVDDYLIDELSGGARLILQHPTLQDVAIVHDERWEGNGSGFHSVFQDGDLYRMYYKAWQLTTTDDKLTLPHPLFTCYAESDDGIHWRKPNLGLVEFKWSMQNNILWADNKSVDAGYPAVFIDTNPDAPPDARFKAIRVSGDFNGLMAFKSPDGIHWTPMSDKNIVSKNDLAMVESGGFFDSQNTAFWDPAHEVYRLYFRYWPNNRRDIMTMTSKDFLNWINPLPLEYPGARPEHLYTNQIKPYYRAPHILVGFPIRYIDWGWTDSTNALPEFSKRRQRAGPHGMTSFDRGNAFTRKPEENYISPPFELGNRTTRRLHWESEETEILKIKFQLRWSQSEAGLEDAIWMGPEGGASFYESSGDTIEGIPTDASWLQYKATLISPYGCGSPRLKAVRIDS